MIPVQGCVKNYHWGKTGNDSYIARFQEAVSSKQEDTAKVNSSNNAVPLAELWFGSHPSGPAILTVDQHLIRLDDFLAKHPEMVGTIEHFKKFNKTLPFLLKILSISQPLSLQAHPDKNLAHILHTKDPRNYPDANHKPELAIALTEFEVLCDFRPNGEIVEFMDTLAPFRRLVGNDNYEQYSQAFKQSRSSNLTKSDAIRISLASCFKSLMMSDKETISQATKDLLSESGKIDVDLIRLIKELSALYPGDPGIFGPFFLNYLKLSPGQAIYLKANKLHAYIKGECIECMACSDNVVRAGLTTKYRDVKTLIGMLDYETVNSPQDILLSGHKHNDAILTYAPTDEFKVDKVTLNQKNAPNGEYTLAHLSSGSFIIVLSGKAMAKDFYHPTVKHSLSLGSALFVPPKIDLRLYNIHGTFTLYRAYC